MAYNYGTVGIASITSGSYQVVSSESSVANTAVRIFDFALLNTGIAITAYVGTGIAAANLIMRLDKNLPFVHSDVGYRCIGGLYVTAITSIASASTAGNLGTINYINEF